MRCVHQPLWTATCRRLGLPLPPLDAAAPTLFSPWRTVLQWDGAAPQRLLGYRNGSAWLASADGQVVALDADGGRFLLPPLPPNELGSLIYDSPPGAKPPVTAPPAAAAPAASAATRRYIYPSGKIALASP